MKKIILIGAAAAVAFATYAEFPSPMPKNTAKLWARQAVAEAKAYTDTAIARETADAATTNDVASVDAKVNDLAGKVASLPSTDDLTGVAELAGEAKGAATANSEAIATLSANKADKSDVYSKAESDATFIKEHQDISGKVDSEYFNATIALLNSKFNDMSARLNILSKTTTPATGKTGVLSESGKTVSVNDATTDVVIGGTVDTGSVNVTAKSVDIGNLDAAPKYGVNGNGVLITSPKVDVAASSFVGATKTSSNLFKVMETESLVIKDTTFTGETYNTIMAGQNINGSGCTVPLKEMTIENCTFAEDCKHINVWFSSFADGAVLNIRNCTFKTCEQFLCVSDMAGKTNNLTINLENIVVESYEKAAGSSYCGIILFDDRICTDEADFLASKPFSHITVNMSNIVAGGVKQTAETFKVGSNDESQMVYIWCAKSGKTYPLSSSTKSLYPKFVLDSTVIVDPAN